VKWHDGKPFTADDCIFNWEYAKDPATAAVTIASYKDIMVEKVDQFTIKVTFQKPTPFWADAFVGTRGMMIPKHLFAEYKGGKSREAPTNLKPVGTGPYLFKDFKPGDLVTGVINPNYHQDNKPYFDAIEMKGGGDAVSAARAVLQTGEFDFAWNMQVEDEILSRLEKGGKGRVRKEMVEAQPTKPVETAAAERKAEPKPAEKPVAAQPAQAHPKPEVKAPAPSPFTPKPQAAFAVTKETIRAVQEKLAGMGLYTKKIDGISGPGTRRAVRAYQGQKKMARTGAIDEALLKI